MHQDPTMTLFASFKYIMVFIIANAVKAADIAREVEGGVQFLSPGPIQLIVPDILSFTIKNIANCRGLFKICYVSEPTKSRDELKRRYSNVGGKCPQDSCTMWMNLDHRVGFGLGAEIHDDNFYGQLVEGSSNTCPRYIVNGRSNFTIVKLPNCPVIADSAQLPKNEETADEIKNKSSMKWIIAICVGLLLLLIVIVIAGFCLCMRLKNKPVHPVNSVRQVQRSTLPQRLNGSRHKKSAKSVPRNVTSPLPKTPTSKKNNGESKLKIQRNSPNSSIQKSRDSNSDTKNNTD